MSTRDLHGIVIDVVFFTFQNARIIDQSPHLIVLTVVEPLLFPFFFRLFLYSSASSIIHIYCAYCY
jgi:hypothetical protein